MDQGEAIKRRPAVHRREEPSGQPNRGPCLRDRLLARIAAIEHHYLRDWSLPEDARETIADGLHQVKSLLQSRGLHAAVAEHTSQLAFFAQYALPGSLNTLQLQLQLLDLECAHSTRIADHAAA